METFIGNNGDRNRTYLVPAQTRVRGSGENLRVLEEQPPMNWLENTSADSRWREAGKTPPPARPSSAPHISRPVALRESAMPGRAAIKAPRHFAVACFALRRRAQSSSLPRKKRAGECLRLSLPKFLFSLPFLLVFFNICSGFFPLRGVQVGCRF